MDLNHGWAGASRSICYTRRVDFEDPQSTRAGLPAGPGVIMTKRLLLALAVALLAPAARAEIPAEQDSCLGCHGSDPSMSHGPPERREAPAPRRPGLLREVGPRRHAPLHRLPHRQGATTRHESKPFKTRRDVTVAYYEQCKKCHFSNYTKTLDGVHYPAGQKGNRQAALCVDCHGSHAIGRPGEPRTRVSDDLLELPQEGLRGLQRQRPREGGHPGQRRRAGLHRLPPRPRRGRSARRGALAAHRRDLRPLPHRPEADEALRPLHQRGRDLPGRLPRHGGVAAEGQEGQGRPAGRRAAPTATACTTSSAPTTPGRR